MSSNANEQLYGAVIIYQSLSSSVIVREFMKQTDDRTHHFNYDRSDWVTFNDLLMAYDTGTLESDDIDVFY